MHATAQNCLKMHVQCWTVLGNHMLLVCYSNACYS